MESFQFFPEGEIHFVAKSLYKKISIFEGGRHPIFVSTVPTKATCHGAFRRLERKLVIACFLFFRIENANKTNFVKCRPRDCPWNLKRTYFLGKSWYFFIISLQYFVCMHNHVNFDFGFFSYCNWLLAFRNTWEKVIQSCSIYMIHLLLWIFLLSWKMIVL